MLKSLASASESRGFDVQVFHCGFDPNSLDMLDLDVVDDDREVVERVAI